MKSTSAKSVDWGLAALLSGVAAVVIVLIWWFVAGLTAIDSRSVEPVDNHNNCYLITESTNNMWLTPGESHTTRGIYCKEK